MPSLSNGDTFALGTLLGNLQHGQERLIYIAEMQWQATSQIAETQRTLAATLARLEARPPACPHPAPPRDAMTWKDKVQLGVFAAAVLAAVLGKLPWRDALAAAGKPFGF